MDINKNIAVWRGNSTPPTQYHLWLKGDALLHHNGTEWILNSFPLSTPDEDGLMSKEDKAKLDNLVYDGVDSNRGDIALSARQGRILSEKITDLNTYVYKPKGSVQDIQDLPLDNLRIGDVYNVVNPFYIQDLRYPGGTNVVWTGEQWDPLGGTVDFSDYYTKEEVDNSKIDKSEKGIANGVATLDDNGSVPQELLPVFYGGISLMSISSYTPPINLTNTTTEDLLEILESIPSGFAVLSLVSDSLGEVPSVNETTIDINPDIVGLVGVKKANVGDIFMIGKVSDTKAVYLIIPSALGGKLKLAGLDEFNDTKDILKNVPCYIHNFEGPDSVNNITDTACIFLGFNIDKNFTSGFTLFIDKFGESENDNIELFKVVYMPMTDESETPSVNSGSIIGVGYILHEILSDYYEPYNQIIKDTNTLIREENYSYSDIIDPDDYLESSVYINGCRVLDPITRNDKYINCEFISLVKESDKPGIYFVEQYLIDNTFNRVYYRFGKSLCGLRWKIILLNAGINTNNMTLWRTPDDAVGLTYFGYSSAEIEGKSYGKLLSIYNPSGNNILEGVTTLIVFDTLYFNPPYMRVVSGIAYPNVIVDWFLLGYEGLEEISYSNLVTKRDNSKLVSGKKYRITDYLTTTTQADTQSAGHQFDVIVVALSKDTLSEDAYVIAHEGDTYFDNSDLNAWQIKYCLDNDTTRFAWADTENGKGVIYYMKDEYNNECPYDFKNIQFKRYKITACPKSPSLVGRYSINGIDGITVDTDNPIWAYTFSVTQDGEIKDASSLKQNLDNLNVYDNAIKVTTWVDNIENDGSILPWFLNNIVFISVNETLYCCSNTFGNGCHSNTFGNGCYSNTFGNGCHSNTFGNGCYFNTFGNDCSSNTFGNYCHSNTFGNYCDYNTFGNGCYFNTFGNYCYSNTLNKDKGGFARYIIIKNGNSYITLNSSTTASSSNYLQNITIAQGYNNTTTKVTITHPTFNDTFRTVYQNPNSKVVEFKDGTRVEYNLSELKAAIDANTTEIETVKASLLKSNYVEDVQDITIQ